MLQQKHKGNTTLNWFKRLMCYMLNCGHKTSTDVKMYLNLNPTIQEYKKYFEDVNLLLCGRFNGQSLTEKCNPKSRKKK